MEYNGNIIKCFQIKIGTETMKTDVTSYFKFKKPFNNKCLFLIAYDDVPIEENMAQKNTTVLYTDSRKISKDGFTIARNNAMSVWAFTYLAIGY